MAGGLYDSSLTRVRPFFTALIARDPSGQGWLGKLLAAPPHSAALGSVLEQPATLVPALTAPSQKGLLGCFEYPVHPPRSLLVWFIEHPDVLVWPEGQTYGKETTRLRNALVGDSPPGSRAAAQAQARALAASRPTSSREWWRFEGTSMIDCVLATESLVVTIEGKRTEPLSAATDWYPARSQLVRNLEAARQLAKGRAWASVLISESPVSEGTDAALDSALYQGAPHLNIDARNELHAHYLGNLTWLKACEATGLDPAVLPESTAEL
jgi:hypothetical protein